MKLKYLILIAFIAISQFMQAQCSSGCVDIQLRNTGSTLEVWLMPTTATYTGLVSLTFTISWDATYNVDLGTLTTVVATIPMTVSGPTGATLTNGSKKYRVYSASATSNTTVTSNTPLKIMTVPVNIPGSVATGAFSISNDAYTTSNNFDYYFDVGGVEYTGTTSSIATSVPLPLELLDFTAKEQNKVAFLTWKTANEVHLSHFDIERSADAKTWTKINQVKAAHTEGYVSNDEKAFLQSNTAFYRLKMVDTDGSFSYSPIRQVAIDKKTSVLKLFPTPTSDVLNIQLEGNYTPDVSGQVEGVLSLYDSLGRKLQSAKWTNTILPIDVSNLAVGTYFIEIQTNSLSFKEKFVKQ